LTLQNYNTQTGFVAFFPHLAMALRDNDRYGKEALV
jgi:hypothetical protein